MSQDFFKNTLKLLESLQKPRTYTTEIEIDEDGYYDKECPNPICLSKFKVHADDWVNICLLYTTPAPPPRGSERMPDGG